MSVRRMRLCQLLVAVCVIAGFRTAQSQCETWLPLGSGISGGTAVVTASTVYENSLIVGGYFSLAGGEPAQWLARWDGATWHAMPGLSGFGWVFALVEYDGQLYAGGYFGIARWNGQSWDAIIGPAGPTYSGAVYALTVHDGKLIAGGDFGLIINGQVMSVCAGWDGSTWRPMYSSPLGSPRSFVHYNGELICGDPNGVHRWDGNQWQSLPWVGQVWALAVYHGDLIAGGREFAKGYQNVARWDGAGWHTMAGGLGSFTYSLSVYNDALVAGGAMTGGGLAGIARWNGTAWEPLDGGVDGQVESLCTFDGRLFAAGVFYFAGGTPCASIAAWKDCVLKCPADLSPPGGGGSVDIDDLLAVIASWGPCPTPPIFCSADISPSTGNGTVDIDDLLAVINGWGPCE